MQVGPVPNLPPAPGNRPLEQSATDAFGLSFESLLRIILTQLTFQDPLKPMDNFEFVSQLAQFSQLQIGQAANDGLQLLVQAEGGSQAAALLGKQVDAAIGQGAVLSGRVTAVSFAEGQPRLTIRTDFGQTITDIGLGAVRQVRESASISPFPTVPPIPGLPNP